MVKDRDKTPRRKGSASGKPAALEGPPRNWFDFHPKITVAGVLFLLMVIFYHQLVFQGMTFGSPDSIAPAGFSRVGLESIEQQHVYPLWNPYLFCGLPSFASLSFNPYIFPPDWPMVLLDKVVHTPGHTIILMYSYLGGLFMALLLLELGLPIMSALVGAIAFAYTPNLVAMGAYGHGSKVATVAFLPLVLWLAERMFKRSRIQDLGWLALALGFQMLRAHIQIIYYTGMAMGLYFLVHGASLVKNGARFTKIVRDGASLAAAYALGFALAAVLLLPVKDYKQYSVRGASEGGGAALSYATRWSFGPEEIFTFFVPSAQGFGGATYIGTVKPFTDYPNYMGLLTLFLAGAGFLLVRDRMSVFALLLGVISLLISFGEYFKPLYEFLYHHLPFFNAFRVPVMILVLLQFSVALLAGRGVYALVGRLTVADRAGTVRRMWIGAGVAAVGMVALLLGAGPWAEHFRSAISQAQPTYSLDILNVLTANAREHYTQDVLVAWGFLAAGLVALALLGLGVLKRTPFWAVLLLLLVTDLWRVGWRITDPPASEVSQGLRSQLLTPLASLQEEVSAEDDVVRFLKSDSTLYRILPVEDFSENRFAGFKIASVGGYNPAKLALYDQVIQAGLHMNPRFWTVANVKYLITRQNFGEGFLQPVPGLAPIPVRRALEGNPRIYQLLEPTPRVWMVGRARVAPGPAALEAYRDSSWDPRAEVLLDAAPKVSPGPQDGSQARVTRFGLNEVEVEVEARSAGLLVASETWYPDWKARVDGREVPLLKADGFIRAVEVPAGRHQVRFTFESPALRDGLRLSLGSAAVSLALILVPGALAMARRKSA